MLCLFLSRKFLILNIDIGNNHLDAHLLSIGELCERVQNGNARKTGTVASITGIRSFAEAAGKP